MRLLSNVKNPLVLLLTALECFPSDRDLRTTAVIFRDGSSGVVLRFFQEMRADNAAEKLKAMLATRRRWCVMARKPSTTQDAGAGRHHSAGRRPYGPSDVRVLSAKTCFLNQRPFTGESLPVREKADSHHRPDVQNPLETAQYLLPGLQRGERLATAVVIHTGDKTTLDRWLPVSSAASADQLR